ncbi:uncharacterized protein [Dermacentor andersoni]|uniref:uncharacterized protein n=1 Tax=Dermacentor andersoni TaxID=34620 RepID=UPI003B3A5342
MDSSAIPFPTEGTVAELPGGSNGDDDPCGHHEALLQTSREPLHLQVHTISGAVYHVKDLASDNTILQLKQHLQDRSGIPPDVQRIIYRHHELADMYTLGECRLTDGCKLHLFVNIRGGYTPPELPKASSATGFSTEAESIKLRAWIRPGNCVEVESHLGATIGSVKESIEKLTGMRAAHQTLMFRGEEMSDEHTLAHYAVRAHGYEERSIYVSQCKGKGATE